MKPLLTIALTALASCTTYYDVRFVPAPLETRIDDTGDANSIARVLVSITGVRKADDANHQPARVEMRMRIENLGTTPLEIEPDSFELVAANIVNFGRGEIAPLPQGPLATGASSEFDLRFPIAPGRTLEHYDFEGLNLRWAVRFGDRRVITGVSFQRAPQPYYYGYGGPGGYPCWHAGVAVGVGAFHDD